MNGMLFFNKTLTMSSVSNVSIVHLGSRYRRFHFCVSQTEHRGNAGRAGLLSTALPDWANIPPNDNFSSLTWLKVAQLDWKSDQSGNAAQHPGILLIGS